jgi:small ligand-binding sensory domain FIST
VGCSGAGVLSDEGEMEGRQGVATLVLAGGELEALPFVVQGTDVAEKIGRRVSAGSGEGSLLVLLPDTFHFHLPRLLADLRQATGDAPVAGGAASGSPMDQATFQWSGGEIVQGGVSGVLLSGSFRTLTGVAQGCRPFGQAYTVTKAEGNVIQELAFGSAVDALGEAVSTLSAAEREAAGPAVFVGLPVDETSTGRDRGDFLVRQIVGADSDSGAIAVSEQVEVGQTVQFHVRTAAAAHEDMVETVSRLSLELGGIPPEFGLYFNCMGRGIGLFGQRDHDVSTIRHVLGRFPFVGFFGNAELAPVGGRNFVHNYTGALVLFEGGAGAGGRE